MRRSGFLASTWQEYVRAMEKLVPESIRSRFFTRKVAYITLLVIVIEVCVVSVGYWLWIQNS